MKHSNHGLVKDEQGQEQPTDKARAQNVHATDPKQHASREATRDPKLREKTPGDDA